MKILHFADAHIDMANYGRHDPQTGLPLRVLDFLKSLDSIVDAAITEEVDLILFAGDAYKDRLPSPTFQREWGKRIMRLSQAGRKSLLLLGNHDLSPAFGRANSIQEFDTLQVPNVLVIDKPCLLSPEELDLPVQIIALPWVSPSGLIASLGIDSINKRDINEQVEARLTDLILKWLDSVDPSLPTILTAHASVQGAAYGNERTVMLGADLVLPGSLVRDPRLDYVALGHIHKAQDLNEEKHPPVIYPGSIERVDFGEAGDDKFYVLASIEKGATKVDWRKLSGIRPFIDCYVQLDNPEFIADTVKSSLPEPKTLMDAVVRLTVTYPREWDPLINEAELRKHAKDAFEFQLIKRPQIEARIRLPTDQTVSSLSPLDLLEQYWRAIHTGEEELKILQELATELVNEEVEQAE